MSTLCDYLKTDIVAFVPDGRSASELLRVVRNRFRSSPYLSLRRIKCRYEAGAVGLHGRVSSYYLKQLAQELAGAQSGMSRVVNHIEVTAQRYAPLTLDGQPIIRRAVG